MAATHISLTLARFDALQSAGPLRDLGAGGVLFQAVGSDARAAGTGFKEQSAYKFVLLGLHDSLESAVQRHEMREEVAPWIVGAKEVWSGVLVPVRHFGSANFLDPAAPGPLYDCPPDTAPTGRFAVVTTAGFDPSEDLPDRARRFGDGVNAVRISMFGTPGLLSTQSFFLEGGIALDGITVTFWNSFAEMRDAIYGSGTHKDWMARQRADNLADRTSFTRCLVERSAGNWHGADPFQAE